MIRLIVAALIVPCLSCGVIAESLKSGIDAKDFDPSVRIQDDLFLHVNGEWLKHTPIPEDKSNYGSFTILMDEALLNLRTIIDEAAAGEHPEGTDQQKVGDFYRSYMNEQLVEQKGLTPLNEQLEKVDALTSVDQVIEHLGALQHVGVQTPIGFFVDQDDKNSSQYLAAIVQSGTTLPDRDYYLVDDPKYVQAREASARTSPPCLTSVGSISRSKQPRTLCSWKNASRKCSGNVRNCVTPKNATTNSRWTN